MNKQDKQLIEEHNGDMKEAFLFKNWKHKEYEQQPKIDEDKAEYGIKSYTDIQSDLHTDIMKLMKALKYMDISADDCLIVFGRVYSTYVLSKLKQDGKIKAIK